MPLPKIAVPTYTCKLPGTGKQIDFRPFLVKEEKVLLLAIQQASELSDIKQAQTFLIKTFKKVLSDCVMNEKFEINELPVFDLEYLFIQVRAKSVGEKVSPTYTCSCGTPVSIEIDLNDITVVKPKKQKMTVDLGGGVGLKMKYPKADIMEKLVFEAGQLDQMFSVLVYCIDSIFDNDSQYKVSDYTHEELKSFLEELPKESFLEIQKFFDNMPHTEYKGEADCPGGREEFTLNQLTDFFE